ncbi:MAG: cob(I)yrinic acid a,c-diamide adenosyltransferase [Nanoarchaeota archaeon]|nr:cob(I)yrinic acid a,c-diamide adenosyltransferase [Nanoarchaeota archaeon]
MVKVYTKVGDKGTTSLLGKSNVSKQDSRVIAYGELDELNTVIGQTMNYVEKEDYELLYKVVEEIFTISSHIACVSDSFNSMLPKHNSGIITQIESRIDDITSNLPELKSFILPVGSIGLTQIHIARTVTRRAERALVTLKDEIEPDFLQLINRLSDYFFTLARKYTQDNEEEEIVWNSKK